MELIIEQFDCMPCTLRIFIINNTKADINNFGYTDWIDGAYECKNHRFISYTTPKPEVLKKYEINETEFNSICYKLQKALYIDNCQRCR